MVSGNYNRAYREPDEACAGRADNPFDHSAQARQSMPRRLRHDMDAMSEACKSEFLQPMDEDAAPHPDHCRDADNRQRRHQPGHGMHQGPPQRAGAGITALSEVKARSEEHTSELQSLMRSSYAGFCLKKKKTNNTKYE